VVEEAGSARGQAVLEPVLAKRACSPDYRGESARHSRGLVRGRPGRERSRPLPPKQILTPSVHFTVDFVKPVRYGDRLTFNLWTVKIGKTSCELRIEASLGGRAAHARQAGAGFIAAGPNRATPIPPELISRMQRFALGEEAPPPKSTRKRRSAGAN